MPILGKRLSDLASRIEKRPEAPVTAYQIPSWLYLNMQAGAEALESRLFGRSGPCYGPPAGPPGVTRQQMAAQARANGDIAAAHASTDLPWFKSQVQTGGPWDYKQRDERFENFGNYAFGYAGTRQQIPPGLLHLGAGFEQLKRHTSQIGYARSWFDDPKDVFWINRGISDALNDCL